MRLSQASEYGLEVRSRRALRVEFSEGVGLTVS
jgi:hypothetical protein